jgi:hypothetical protein
MHRARKRRREATKPIAQLAKERSLDFSIYLALTGEQGREQLLFYLDMLHNSQYHRQQDDKAS